jgi:hypothetical protein
MEPATETQAPARPAEVLTSGSRSGPRHKTANTYRFREEWLQAAISLLTPMFAKADAPIPDDGRAAIGFTSKGGKGNCVGECWHPIASADKHFEIFIRPDHADPVEVLGILTHELVHAAVPLGSGHGPIYKALALKIGLEGKMRHAMPGMHLVEVLKGIAAELGPLPHAALDIQYRESAPRKKQKTNMLKAFCEGVKDESGKVTEGCDYVCRLTKTHAEKGAPICGVHQLRMIVEFPTEEEPGAGEAPPEGEEGFKAPPAPVEEGFKAPPASPVSEGVNPSPGYRLVNPDEVFPAGHSLRVNLATGQQEVSEVASE